ncbi:leucine/isoleucine/valine transporter subunit; ATP-binding component of ABC superfamily [Pseudodesulfovibrio profundus]|uniref:Leucine/isoleucine/valine transporter subunit ATP-binding component of ABC superfamily n=1 Tax=Pseudodesulfovibrio profundus TaxID=57320 RepID=A0A2C8FE98_9BACT|nr:ABC transporter ATP-binding protein [Pseudodesulfovibrio profundus]SOB60793.1 leucine/isoleucine/valine transporter subunit; ATP-binding component of ABC superfamily [Pseudodesulfovibrio profundus]
MSNPVLNVNAVSKDFGGIRALDEVDLVVNDKEIVALIGPNGAGKTTFFNCITGIYTPTSGDVLIDPEANGNTNRINGKKPNIVTELGMARTFQNIRLFPSMTALENVMIGTHCRTKSSVWGAISRNKRTRNEEQAVIQRSYELLELVGLGKYVNELASNIAYGKQRRLEIARALATDPFLLLLDEPAAGMNPQETLDLEKLIVDIREQFNISIMLIEHDMKMVMSMSDRIYVLDYGRMIAEGTPQEIAENPDVIKAYLGEGDDE